MTAAWRAEAMEKLLSAADGGGWGLVKRYGRRCSYYLHLRHPDRGSVVARISDHPGKSRRGEKLLSVTTDGSLRKAIEFLRRRMRPAARLPRRAPLRCKKGRA